jgi:uncharacterized membrane protein YqgA involved in biofilm formation
VSFSPVTVLAVQCGLTLFSGHLTVLNTQRMMHYIDGVSGIIVLAIGHSIYNLEETKTIYMLPSIIYINYTLGVVGG